MALKHVFALACAALGISLAGCGDSLVSGTIQREKTNFTFNDDIVFTEEAHVAISLSRYEGEDQLATPVTKIDLPFTGFPFDFEVPGEPDEAFANDATLLLVATIYNHAGSNLAVGDLMNENTVQVEEAGTHLQVQAGALEPCDAPNAGGFCF